ncbi:MAG: tRNA uridine-5-carboxymethylaminomethyl(34) synthesis GTPase MnmE [Pseudanabaenaceae cyanobacterium]
MHLGDTIVAIATAISPAQGSIGIVRLSGVQAQSIAQKLFHAKGKQRWESHRVLYGEVRDPHTGELVDEVLLLPMLAPRSYTREDVVEFHCHGGIICVQRVLSLCLQLGARLALAGEFTTRAFLNGRIDLTQAEAIQDLIAAKSNTSAQMALSQLGGKLKQSIRELRQGCIEILAEIEAHIDFVDDLPELDPQPIKAKILATLDRCRQLLNTSTQGRILREGIKIAIVGRPNVGKSSLLNAWSKSDRAIVTDLPGTTRDIIDSYLVVQGMPVQILDTAGIRETDNLVEEIGIQRSQQAALTATLVLLVLDGQQGWTEGDRAIYELVKGKPLIFVVNKSDIAPADIALPVAGAVVRTSALHSWGIEELEEKIWAVLGTTPLDLSGSEYAINQRQQACLTRAVAALDNLLQTIEANLPLDFWTIDLRQAIHSLGEITGDSITENLLDEIFSRFCIGK